MTFRLYVVQLRGAREDANTMRGRLGKALYGTADYPRLFAPTARNGPSGLRDLPRPFVLRAGQQRVHVFSNADDARVIACALGEPDALVEEVKLGFEEGDPIRCLRVAFRSPTLLKGSDTPDFPALFARARDRVSTLRALYGDGALDIDFRLSGELSRSVMMTHCNVQQQALERRSGRTGQVHPIGGFTGTAEYEGDLTPFVPILRAATFTGVGSKPSWGNGWIELETESAAGSSRYTGDS